METAQEVVIIQDSSNEVCVSFMKWVTKGLPLKAGDKLTLISVLHQVNTPLGPVRVDSSSVLDANPRIVECEAERIRKQYETHVGLAEICRLYGKLKVEFNIEVAIGPSCKLVGVEASKHLNATLVILDRKLKSDRNYFIDNISCGIWRIKDNCKIEQLRALKASANNKNSQFSSRFISLHNMKRPLSNDQTSSSSTYTPEDQDLFSIEFNNTPKKS